MTRRAVLEIGVAALAAGTLIRRAGAEPAATKRPVSWPFMISLAQWSLNRTIFGGGLDNLDFPKAAKTDYGIEAVEYVNQFFKGRADAEYVGELRKRCDDLGVRSLLIMCDGEGALGDPDEGKRKTAVENHHKWVEAAERLGCHSIRVNAQSEGSFEDQQNRAADGLRKLCEFAHERQINVIVENHWGLSSNGNWLAGVMRKVDHPRCGTLPDFGNFDPKEYDRYVGVKDLMPFAKGVSAKSYDFDEAGNETTIDYKRMIGIVMAAGYHGHIGIEYEGKRLSEPDGIRATKRLLERLHDELKNIPEER